MPSIKKNNVSKTPSVMNLFISLGKEAQIRRELEFHDLAVAISIHIDDLNRNRIEINQRQRL